MVSAAASLFLGCCIFLQTGAASGNEEPWVIIRDGPDVTVEIDSKDGVVTSSTVAAALAEVADFDGDVLNEAMSFGELNLSESRTRWGLRGLNLALPDGIHFRARRGDDNKWQLRIDLNLDELDESTREIRRRARELVDEVVDGDDPVVFGLTWHESPAEPMRTKIVILIHGYTSSAAAMHPLADALTQAGYQCGFIEYPNDGPLTDAAEFISATLSEDKSLAALLNDGEDRSITLITHSMGGLAARWMLEHEELRPAHIEQLIMIAPPSQGSNIAYLPGALDLFEHWLLDREIDLESFIERSFADGLEEAHNDLRPGSRFIRELNECPRCAGIDYTIVLGNSGIVSDEELDRMRAAWTELCAESQLAQFAAPRIDAILADPQEFLEGEGDGLVAVSRGRLDGVQDVVVLPMNHGTPCRDLDCAAGRQLLETILNRLDTDAAE